MMNSLLKHHNVVNQIRYNPFSHVTGFSGFIPGQNSLAEKLYLDALRVKSLPNIASNIHSKSF